MCHRAARRNIVIAVRQRARRTVAAADIRRPRPEDCARRALRPARTEFQHDLAARRAPDTAGFGGNQCLMVDGQQDHRLDKLSLYHGACNRNNRLAGEYRRALGHRPHVTLELEIL